MGAILLGAAGGAVGLRSTFMGSALLLGAFIVGYVWIRTDRVRVLDASIHGTSIS